MKSKKTTTILVALATIGLFVLLVPIQASAATRTYNWSNTAANNYWNYSTTRWGGTIPVAGDTASIGASDNSNKIVYVDANDTANLAILNLAGASGNIATLRVGANTTGGSVTNPILNSAAININGYGTLELSGTGTVRGSSTGTGTALTVNTNGAFTQSGGTLTATSLTLSGGTFTKTGGAFSNVGTLTLNGGTLNLGSSTLAVSSDYSNSTTGIGNSYNPKANVTGTINGSNAGHQISGANVKVGNTSSTTVDFGNVHESSTGITKNYTSRIAGTTGGTSIRGAVQTTANGALIDDGRLTGAGVTGRELRTDRGCSIKRQLRSYVHADRRPGR